MWIDLHLKSAPCLTLVLMVIGLSLAVFGTYRLVKRTND